MYFYSTHTELRQMFTFDHVWIATADASLLGSARLALRIVAIVATAVAERQYAISGWRATVIRRAVCDSSANALRTVCAPLAPRLHRSI